MSIPSIDREFLKKTETRFENDYFEIIEGSYHGAEVAMKKLKCQRIPYIMEEFKREIEMLAKIPPHDNVVKFYGASLEEGDMFLVEELAQTSLEELLQLDLTLSWKNRIKIAMDIAAGLLHLHTQNPKIMHRDIKSANVLVFSNDDVDDFVILAAKLCDFGFARVKSEINRMTGQRGTPSYISPEVLCPGDRDNMNAYDEAADIYSYGIVLWEIASRQVPFDGKNVLQVAQAVLSGDRPPMPEDIEVAAFTQLIQDCWDQEPSVRPNAATVLSRLQTMYKSLEGSSS